MAARILSSIVLVTLALAGCGRHQDVQQPRSPLTLDEIAITVRDTPRGFMFSDKAGGFFIGHIARGFNRRDESWSVGGRVVPSVRHLRAGNIDLTDARLDSAVVRPDRLMRFYADGTTETMAVLDHQDSGAGGSHQLLVEVRCPREEDVVLTLGRSDLPGSDRGVYRASIPGVGVLSVSAGGQGVASDSGVSVRQTRLARFRFELLTGQSSGSIMSGDPDTLLARRASRLEQLLNRSYLRTSDTSLNRALCWVKASLDAMLIEAADTFVVAGVPWDGALSGRENAQSIAGLGLATGDYRKTASIIRTLSRWQDREPLRDTYGRIPDRVDHGKALYGGADIGPWFVREMYEHVVYANDTGLARALYPAIQRGIEGTLKYHTDRNNFLVHGDNETWMSRRDLRSGRLTGVPRGNRAVEMQLLWYFQQMIGSYIASYVGDTASASRWATLSRKTSSGFDEHFVDTVTNTAYDHLTREGKGVAEMRPNALFCLEILGSEAVQQQMIKTMIGQLVYRHGCGTLGAADPRFRPRAGDDAAGMFNGPVWTWLAGQIAYALSRYDRQDFSFQITDAMVEQLESRGMVGALPAMMDVTPRDGTDRPAGAGDEASATGMAEFVRAFYQDYLGLRIDVPSNQFYLQPKLPDRISDVDFTVFFGSHPVNGRIERRQDVSRIVLNAPTLPRPVRVGFLWMLDSGDAWRASTNLGPDATLTIAIGRDDLLAYNGDRQAALIAPVKLKKFSLRESFAGFDFAPMPKR